MLYRVGIDEYARGAARIVVKPDTLVHGDLFRVTPTDRNEEDAHRFLMKMRSLDGIEF
jgi:hypothetical protein